MAAKVGVGLPVMASASLPNSSLIAPGRK